MSSITAVPHSPAFLTSFDFIPTPPSLYNPKRLDDGEVHEINSTHAIHPFSSEYLMISLLAILGVILVVAILVYWVGPSPQILPAISLSQIFFSIFVVSVPIRMRFIPLRNCDFLARKTLEYRLFMGVHAKCKKRTRR